MKENFRIGFVVEKKSSYYKTMASTRLRVYDVIKALKERKVKAGFFYFFKKYDVVIFQKAFSSKYISLAEKLKKKGIKIILDINVNYIDKDYSCVTNVQQNNIKSFLKIADVVLTSSTYLKSVYEKYHSNTCVIEEMINERFLKKSKKHLSLDQVKLFYCGHAEKAKELLLIKDVLIKFYNLNQIELVIIAEKDPGLDIIPYKFVKYCQKKIPEQMLECDINLNPRDISRVYNLGHSFTKIGYPMSVEIPVLTSFLPAYAGSPAIFCKEDKDWWQNLDKLIMDSNLRNDIGKKGHNYVRDHFSKDIIVSKYIDLFSSLV